MKQRATEGPLDLERFASEALSETGQLLVPLFSSSPLGIAFCDKGLRFRAINNTLAAMNGIPAEAHLGKTVRHVVGPVASQVEPAFRRVFATGEKFSIEVAGKLPKRAEWGYWIEDYYPIRDRQGKVKQVCVTVMEISRIKKLEESLFGLTAKLLDVFAALKPSIDANFAQHVKAMQTAQSAKLFERCVSEILTVCQGLSPSLPNTSEISTQAPPVLASKVRDSSLSISGMPPANCISDRECEVLRLLVAGSGNKEVAATLDISVRTVEAHRTKIMLKLGIHSFAELVRYAVRNGLIDA